MAGAVSHDELQGGYGRNYGSGPRVVKERRFVNLISEAAKV